MAIGIEIGKYDQYAGTLIERYPLAMDNLIKLEWLGGDMNEEEKYRLRSDTKEVMSLVTDRTRRANGFYIRSPFLFYQ